MTAPEASKYYDCDPFIPGAFPEDHPEVYPRLPLHSVEDPRHPLGHFISVLNKDLTDDAGHLLVSEGAPVIELGFVKPLHPLDKDQRRLQKLLSHIAGPLRLAHMALEGHPIDLMDEDDLSYLGAPFREQGQLPPAVVAHTRPDVAEIAVSDFGFEHAGSSDCIPEPRARAIQSLGHTPATIYRLMDRFMSIEVTRI